MRWFVRIGAVILVAGGLAAVEIFKTPRHWLAQHLNQVSLAITALALLVAAYAAEEARRAVIQSTQFRDIDRLEDIRDEVVKLVEPHVSLPLSRELSSFDNTDLPDCYALSRALSPGTSPDQALVTAARAELTARLSRLREKVYR